MKRAAGEAFRTRLTLASSAVGLPAAAVVLLYLAALLELTREQWTQFAIGAVVFTVGFTFVGQWLQRRLDQDLASYLDAEAAGSVAPELRRNAYRVALALPLKMIGQAYMNWVLAGLFIPVWMHLLLGDLSAFVAVTIVCATLAGGFVSSTLVYFSVDRLLRPIRARLAATMSLEERERGAYVVPFAGKLAYPMAGLLLAAVVFSVLMAVSFVSRPIEIFSTKIQLAHLERAIARVDVPGNPRVSRLREELVELGVAEDVWVLDLASGEPVGGLSPQEVRFVQEADGDRGTSRAIDSSATFSWIRVPSSPRLAVVALAPGDASHAGLAGMEWAFVALAFGYVGAALLITRLFSREVGRRLERLQEAADRIARGDLRPLSMIEGDDEFGVLARGFEQMTASLRETVGGVVEATERLGDAAQAFAETSGSVARASAEQGSAIVEVRSAVESVHQQVAGITDSAQSLTGNVEEASSSVLELGAAGEELNHTASALSEQVDSVGNSIEQMIRSAGQIGTNTQNLAEASAETSASMTEMAASMRDVDRNAEEMARLSGNVVEFAGSGLQQVQKTIVGMEKIQLATDDAEGVIRSLGERVDRIGDIVDVIDDVADETSLLALNAAIIAAQAGEHGRAFSVVADEITELADRVLSSTKEIGSLIHGVQDQTTRAVAAIEEGTRSVGGGVGLSAEAGRALEEINDAARATGGRVDEIVSAVREQSRASEHVASLMERVNLGATAIRESGRDQERGNQMVLRSTSTMRDVAQQVHRTTDEQARGASRIRDSMESVRDEVDRIHASLRSQAGACGDASSFLDQILERTRTNDQATHQMSRATETLNEQIQALRQDMRRFEI